jgi:hypothetical protein
VWLRLSSFCQLPKFSFIVENESLKEEKEEAAARKIRHNYLLQPPIAETADCREPSSK